jgi:hypothetical protein
LQNKCTGLVLDMISRQKHNEALGKARRERAQYVRDKYLEYGVRSYIEYKPVHKELSEGERQAIRDQVRKDYRKSRRRSIAVFVGAILLIVSICFIILHFY